MNRGEEIDIMPRNRYTLSYDHHPQNPCHHRPSALRRGNNIASAPQEAQDLFNAMSQARCVRKKAMDILGLDSWSTLYRRMLGGHAPAVIHISVRLRLTRTFVVTHANAWGLRPYTRTLAVARANVRPNGLTRGAPNGAPTSDLSSCLSSAGGGIPRCNTFVTLKFLRNSVVHAIVSIK